MSKKIIGLLLVLCLVVGLLPVVALAEDPTTVAFALCKWEKVGVTEGDEAVYYKNVPIDLYLDEQGTPAGVQGYTTPVKSDKNDWNIKFEYPAGGIPTVTLKDAKIVRAIDGKPAYTLNGGEYKKFGGEYSAIGPNDSKFDVKFVLEGDNVIDYTGGVFRGNPGGIEAFNNVTIESVNGGKLTCNGGYYGITAEKNGTLTFNNAIVDITNTRHSCVPIYSEGGNIVINGGHVTIRNNINAALQIDPTGTVDNPVYGSLTVTDAKFTVISELVDVSEGTGAVNVSGNITVNGNSELNIEGLSNPGLLANNGDITINGGKINVTSPETNGLTATVDGQIKINGGTVEVTALKAFNKAPVLAAGINGVAGASADEADYYDETKFDSAYVKLGADIDTPTQGTETPTQGTEAPTQAPTQAATQAPTQGNQNPGTGDNGIVMFSALLLVAVFGIVATVAFGKKNSVAE